MNQAHFLELYLHSPFFLPAVFVFGLIGGLFSCALLEVPFLAALVSVNTKSKKEAFGKASVFVLGLTVSYVIIGLFFGQLAKVFAHLPKLTFYLFILMGLLSLGWGLWLILRSGAACGCGSHDHHHGGLWSKINLAKHGQSWGQIFLVGSLFAWLETPVCPCCGPVIYVLSALTVLKGQVLFGMLTFAIYSLGQGVPVVLFCVFLAHWVNHPLLLKSRPYFELLMSNVLVAIGLLLLWIA